MSGILDNKSRVIDAILTYEGRRQMVDGNFAVRYVTFSDKSIVYDYDEKEGHIDPTNRIYLEAFNAPFDEIVFTADDSGNLEPFRQHSAMGVNSVTGEITSSQSWTAFVGGKIKNRVQTFSKSENINGGFSESAKFGGDFASQIEGILTSSIDNYQSLYAIGTADPLFQDYNFGLNSNEISFTVSYDHQDASMYYPTNVNTVDSLFNDEKLRNIDNFLYLPPIKKTTYSIDKTDFNRTKSAGLLLGDYPAWGPTKRLDYVTLKKELDQYESKTIQFDPTSRDNDIVGQFFEIRSNEVRKLDVIDFGVVHDNSENLYDSTKHVFFVGKIFVDETGSDCFIHLFTLVFSSNDGGG